MNLKHALDLSDAMGARTAVLGSATNDKYTDADIGRLVKYGTAENFVKTAVDEAPDGIIVAIERATANQGYSYGTVRVLKSGMRFEAAVANATANLSYVNSGAQPSAGFTYPTVKAVASGTSRVRIISVGAADSAGTGLKTCVCEVL